MTDKQEVKPERVNNDRMAIIVAGIAIGIAVISAPGLYALMNIPIGLVLLMTLLAVDSHRDDSWFQSASFALAGALTSLVIVGVFLVNPYLTNDQGIFKTDTGYNIRDPLTGKEIPAVEGIKHILGDEAGDAVSVCFVSIIAIIWLALRRRFFAVHKKPSQPQDEDKGTTSSKSSTKTRSASTSLASEPEQRRVDKVILTVFTTVMVLLVYVISTRGSKKNS